MRQLRYNHASNVLRFEYPAEWDASEITGLTLTVLDSDANELLAADAATLYAATTLDSDLDKYLSSATLDSGAGDLDPGDPLLFVGINGTQYNRVKGYDSTSKVAELETIAHYAFEAGDSVYGEWATYTLDTTTTTDFEKGEVVTLLWTPTGTGQAVAERVQISSVALDIQGLERRFSRLYPRAYASFTEEVNRFSDMAFEAESQIELDLLAENLHIQRVVDQDILAPLIMAKMAFLWTVNGDEQMVDERDFLMAEYERRLGVVKKLPLWSDNDQDLEEEITEVNDHMHIFERGW